jgi:hypothetical protein
MKTKKVQVVRKNKESCNDYNFLVILSENQFKIPLIGSLSKDTFLGQQEILLNYTPHISPKLYLSRDSLLKKLVSISIYQATLDPQSWSLTHNPPPLFDLHTFSQLNQVIFLALLATHHDKKFRCIQTIFF